MPASSEPIPTIKQAFPPVAAPINDASRPSAITTKRQRNFLPWLLIGFLIFLFGAGAIVGAFVISARRAPLVWHLVLAVDPSTADLAAVTKQTAEVIERRLDAFGVKYRVTPQSNGQILLDLPSVENPERLKALISTGGKLELTHVISPGSPSPVQTYATNDEAVASLNSNGTIPPNRRVLPYTDRDDADAAGFKKWVVVEAPAIVDGSELRDARAVAARSGGSDYQIAFSLNKTGAEKFGAWTGANINEYLGVVLNGEVKSVAFIKSQIYDQGQIEGRFTKQSAEDLALVLKAGALPAKISFLEERIDK
jgi:preprotein translocase subunit SecD